MALIDDIVNVTITQGDFGVTTATFDKLLIIGDTKNSSPTTVATYANMTEVAVDFEPENAEYKAAALAFSQSVKPSSIMIGNVATGAFVNGYQAIKLLDDSFYGVVITSKTEATILGIAAAVEADVKIFGVSTNSASVLASGNTTNIAYKLKDAGYKRTFCLYSNDSSGTSHPEAAVLGLALSYDPGSINWCHKQINGVSGDSFNSSQRTALDSYNCNSIQKFAGRNVYFWGKMADGSYADILHGTDWLKSNIQDNVASVLQASLKIPYTDAGVAIITNALKTALYQAADNNFLDRDTISVTAPLVANVSTTDKANRILPDVYFEARTSGAINKVKINGVLSL